MARKSVKTNYLFNVAYQIIMMITPLITAPYLSRVLQPDGIGRVSFVESIVSYFSLVAVMGISTYGQREISYVQDDLEKRSEVFWNVKILGCFISGFTILIYLLFAMFQGENSTLYLILTISLISNFVDITWFFQGMEDFAKTVVRNTVCRILLVVYIFSFVRSKEDLPIYVLGQGLFAVMGNISLWAYLPKYVLKVPFYKLHPFRNFKSVLSLFIPTIAIQVYTVLDKTMIGLITGNSFENGYYEQALKLTRIFLTLVTSISTVMMPRIGFLLEKKRNDEIQTYLYRGCRFVWFLSIPLCLGIIMTSSNFVPWFFGKGYDRVVPNLVIHALIIPIVGLGNVTGIQYLLPAKKENLYTRSVVSGSILNIILNSFMIRLFGSVGAAIASVLSEILVTSMQLYFVRNVLSTGRIINEGKHYFIAGGIMALVLFPVVRYLSPSIINTLVLIVLGVVIYFAILLFEKDMFFISSIKMIVGKIIRPR